MTEFILVYLFFASCMLAANRLVYNPRWFPALSVSLLWPWFLFASIFEKIIK